MDSALLAGTAEEQGSSGNGGSKINTHDACFLLSGIVLASLASLGLAAYLSLTYSVVLGHAFLAFMLGLRHAVDCDHLAAIDNVTRQFTNRGERPVSIGFWFAAGHSTVVVALTGFIACGYTMAWKRFHNVSGWSDNISLAASVISISLLSGIGLLNARVSVELFFEWTRMRRRSLRAQENAEKEAAESSLRTALSTVPFLQWVFGHVDRPEKMYLVGLLFGLSFDTATQVGLIGLAAMTSTTGAVPASIVMVIPLCFSTGMCLVDTGNGILMLLAYTWATVRPMEKLFYNFLVTALSAVVAILIGSLEMLQTYAQQSHLKGSPWSQIKDVDMASVGFFIIMVFAVIFGLSVILAFAHRRYQRADTIDEIYVKI